MGRIEPVLVAAALCAACAAPTGESEDGVISVDAPDARPSQTIEVPGTPTEPEPDAGPAAPLLATDLCDDDVYEGGVWVDVVRGPFVFRVLEGSPAAADVDDMASRRDAAYADIASRLVLPAQPPMTLVMSPSRVAAGHHGYSTGYAFPASRRIEVVYPGSDQAYEAAHAGHELTHVLLHPIAPSGTWMLRVLDEGFAELFDQSQRDMHRAYADKLRAGLESEPAIGFDTGDLYGRNYGRAGSLAATLAELLSPGEITELLRAAAVAWDADCMRHPQLGCVNSVDDLQAVLALAVETASAYSWGDVVALWTERVHDARLELARNDVEAGDRAAIVELLAEMDRAISEGDPARYRTTMEGFYCDWGGEPKRRAIAGTAVFDRGPVESDLIALYPTGVRNFPEMVARVRQREASGSDAEFDLWLEKLPDVGWRVTWGPDWQ